MDLGTLKAPDAEKETPLVFRSRAVLFSLALHGLLLFLFFHHGSQSQPPPVAMMIELPERGARVEDANRESGRARSGQARGGARAAGGFRWKSQPNAWESGGAGALQHPRAAAEGGGSSSAGSSGGGRGAAVEGYANGMSVHEEGKFFPLAEKIWKRIDAFVTYPHDFATEHIQGAVTLHIVVDETGRFTGDFLEVVGDDLALRTYVMAMVAYALRTPLEHLPAEWVKKGPQRVPLALRFTFRLVNPGMAIEEAPAFHFKNALSFERVAVAGSKAVEDILRWQAENLPIIVAGPGVSINLPLIQSYLEKGAPPHEGEKRAYRMEINQELWNQWIKESAVKQPGPASLQFIVRVAGKRKVFQRGRASVSEGGFVVVLDKTRGSASPAGVALRF